MQTFTQKYRSNTTWGMPSLWSTNMDSNLYKNFSLFAWERNGNIELQAKGLTHRATSLSTIPNKAADHNDAMSGGHKFWSRCVFGGVCLVWASLGFVTEVFVVRYEGWTWRGPGQVHKEVTYYIHTWNVRTKESHITGMWAHGSESTAKVKYKLTPSQTNHPS